MGFPVPIELWFRKDGLLSERLDLLLDNNSYARELLNRKDMEKLLEEHRSGKANHADDLWILLSLELWKRRFFA